MEIPEIGTVVEIHSMKHNNEMHRRWEKNTVLYSDKHIVIGGNDQTIVEEANGDKWRTTEPAIFYFDNRYWFNIIYLIGEADTFYYCNLSSPYTYKNKTLQYIDYDIDLIVKLDHKYEIVDLDEYEANKQQYQYPQHVQQAIKTNLQLLQTWINREKHPFNQNFIEYWYNTFLEIN